MMKRWIHMWIPGSVASYARLGLLYGPVFDSVNIGQADTDLEEVLEVFGEGVSPSREI